MNYVFLANGFEEIEAVSTIDILRRADIDTTMVSIEPQLAVIGAHNIVIVADKLFSEASLADAETLILPGGMPGTSNLNKHEGLKQALKAHAAKGKLIGAICAAPLILGELQLLQGKQATCYPSFEPHLHGATLSNDKVVDAGEIVTGKGPGFGMDFALALVKKIKGEDTATEVAKGLLLQ
ncbi:MAG: DJ-1/PfpI family protein [Paludibacteraceae bacterium]|nr:DJ-1/PfpI family protein [Paludibacteraceae bacterium]